jgi:uncharacterized membrane protein
MTKAVEEGVRGSVYRVPVDPRVIWFVLIGLVFYLLSKTDYPTWLTYVGWRYVHILSAAVYSGIVFTSAVIEAVAFYRGDLNMIRGYHDIVRVFDQRLITASITGLFISAQAMLTLTGYQVSILDPGPLWARLALLLILANGLYWLALDVPNQRKLGQLFEQPGLTELTAEMRALLMRRTWVNLPSVLLLPVLYFLMVFKPT